MKSISKITPGYGNKMASYIMSLNGTRVFYAILISVVLTLIPVLLAYYDGNFINPALKMDIKTDWPNLLFYVVGFPTMLLTTILYANKLPKVLHQLKENEIIKITESGWNNFIKEANFIYSRWYYTLGPHLLAAVITAVMIYVFRNPKNTIWYSLETEDFVYFAGWAQIPVYYATFYTFSLGILNIFASYRVLSVLFSSNKLIVQPLHPDKCGGLAPLGALSRTLIYWIILIGVVVALNVYNNYYVLGRHFDDPIQQSIILGYFVMAYVTFFLPMHAAHKPMKKAKEEELGLIHKYISRVNQELKKDFEDDKSIDNEALENFNNAKLMYDITIEMPVYPYNLKTIAAFISSILIPILFSILQKIIDGIY